MDNLPEYDPNLVYTIKGLLPRDQLDITDVVTYESNARVVATEWRKDGELVRRDVHVNLLRGLELGAAQGSM